MTENAKTNRLAVMKAFEYSPSMPLPSVVQLTKALALAQKIQEAEAELASIMSGSAETPTAKKRGRPPGRPAARKRSMSDEGRKRIAEAQKKRWAEKKKAEGKK